LAVDPNLAGDDLKLGGDDLIPVVTEPNPGADDLNPAGSQPKTAVNGGNVAKPQVTPQGRASGQRDKLNNRVSGAPGSASPRR
jgi:hypothetical protein